MNIWFSTTLAAVVLGFGPHGQASEEAQVSQLPLTLIGTIVRSEANKSLGTIKFNSSGQTQTYFTGDKVSHLAKVTGFKREQIYFTNLQNGKLEYLRIPAFDPSKAASKAAIDSVKSSSEMQVDRKLVNQVISDLPTFLGDAKMSPVLVNGKVVGFKFDYIKPGSAYTLLGLQEGDQILSVNGEVVDSPAKGLEIFRQLQGSSMIDLKIGRGGRPVDIRYLIR